MFVLNKYSYFIGNLYLLVNDVGADAVFPFCEAFDWRSQHDILAYQLHAPKRSLALSLEYNCTVCYEKKIFFEIISLQCRKVCCESVTFVIVYPAPRKGLKKFILSFA